MVRLRQRTWMTYRFCFFTSSYALYDFFQKSLRNFVSGPPFKRIWKAAGLIRKFGINPMKIRSIFFVVWQSFSFAEFLLLFYSFLADRSKRSANSPENYPFILIRQLLKLFISEDTNDSRTFTLNQNFRFCKVRTRYKMQATHKVFAQAIYPLMNLSIA